MPTAVLRPDSTTSQTGFSTANIHTVIGDNNTATSAEQNDTSCQFTGTLDDLDSSLSAATINSIKVVLVGVAGRAGQSQVQVTLLDGDSGTISMTALNFTGVAAIKETDAVTTTADGDALTPSYINNLSLILEPNQFGITIQEAFASVDYDLATSAGDIIKLQGRIKINEGRISI